MLTEHVRRWPKCYPKYDRSAAGEA